MYTHRLRCAGKHYPLPHHSDAATTTVITQEMKHSKRRSGKPLFSSSLSWEFLVEETTTRSTCWAGSATRGLKWDPCRFRARNRPSISCIPCLGISACTRRGCPSILHLATHTYATLISGSQFNTENIIKLQHLLLKWNFPFRSNPVHRNVPNQHT